MPKRFKKSSKKSFSFLIPKEYFLLFKQKIFSFILNSKNLKIFFWCILIIVLASGFWFGRGFFADKYYQQAQKYESFGDDIKAIELSKKAIKIFPRNSDYWRFIGEIRSKQTIQKIQQTKLNSVSQEEHAQILREDAGETLLYLQKAIEIDPDNWQNQSALGFFYESLIGYVPDAQREASFSYLHAAELSPDDLSLQVASLRNLIFYADSLESQRRNNEKNQALLLAQNILNKIKSRHLSDNIYHFYNGLILLRSSQYNAAVDELKIASDAFPDNAYLFYEIGLAYFAKGDRDDATAFLTLKIVQNSVYSKNAQNILNLYEIKH